MSLKKIAKIDFISCWLPLLVGLLLTVVATLALNYENEYRLNAYSHDLATKTENLIEQRFEHFEYGLRSTRGAIVTAGVNSITRQQFENYINSRDLAHEFSAALGFGFIRRVPVDQEAQFLAQARKNGAPNFTIRTLTPHDRDRFVIEYIYPIDKNAKAMGLDIGSEENRRTAAISAARDDKTYLTAPITLVQANKKSRQGALILLPVYANNTPQNTSDAREKLVAGWVYAPLVIDDVLANLHDLTDQAFITLTNLKEGEPFYRSRDQEAPPNQLEHSVTQTIYLYGQKWKLQLTPSAEAASRIQPWNLGWIIILGLSLTFCVLVVINILRTDSAEDDENTTYRIDLQSVRAFFKIDRFKRSYPFILFTIALIGIVSGGLIVQNQLQEARNDLLQANESALSYLTEEVSQYRRDVLFLANTPATEILKTLHTNITSPEEFNAAIQRWHEQLEETFKAYMLSKKDVYQVRFIKATDNWQESVKVQRLNGELVVLDQALLQSKINEPYIEKTLQVGANNVYNSDINLNRERGKIEQPEQPVWRFSTPLFHADGSILGIFIINVTADHLLKMAASNLPPETEVYITNTQGEFLCHPNASKSFTFEHGFSHRWQDEFTPSASDYGLDRLNLKTWQGAIGDVLGEHSQLMLGDSPNHRVLNIYSTKPLYSVFNSIAWQFGGVIALLLIAVLISVIIQYWIWLTDKIHQKDIWNAQVEAQRQKETARFKALLESAPDATFVMNEACIIQLVNAQAVKMFGYSPLELEGQSIEKLLPNSFSDTHKAQIMDDLQQSKAICIGNNEELFALTSDEKEFPIEVSLSAMQLDEKVLISASVRDITERLANEQKLRTALRHAEMATDAKSAFLANTSHEIRTPLNAIIGLSYLLAEDQLTEAQHQLVSKIQVSGKSLLGIVNDVLDLSKIEANAMELDTHPVELRALIEEISSVFVLQADAKDLAFNIELSPDLPDWVVTDSLRLRQILVNLLSNALKFTTTGHISISADVNTEAEGTLLTDVTYVRLSVTDTGIGIPQDVQAHLFTPFTQADSSTTRQFGGTGLGLSIVHQLAQLMGGTVGVESTEHVGSTFWVDLPFNVQTPEETALQENQSQTLFVLIAEDDPADAKQLQGMAHALGWRTKIVKDGTELVETYLKRKESQLRPPDVIITDWQMPIMDGISAISTLANQIGDDKIPAVLMVSAHDKDSITPLDVDNVIHNFLLKPVNASTLFNAVNDVVIEHTGNMDRVFDSSSVEAVSAKWLVGTHILVVDDSETNLVVVSHILEHNGALVQTAHSGEEALSLLKTSAKDYDAVLMDIQMPGIDGLETTQRARQDLGLSALPIIALTAGALLEEKKRALQAGMNDFLTKPIDPTKLINILRTLIAAYRGETIRVHPINEFTAENDHTWPVIAGLNIDKAKNLLLNDRQLFLTTLDTLLTEHSNLTEPPKTDLDAPQSSDARLKIASQVHKLRSASGMVGAEEIHQLSAKVETALRTDGEPANDLLTALSYALLSLKTDSAEVVEQWRKEKLDASAIKTDAPPLKQETVQHILRLLAEQDLNALDKIDTHSASIREALGDEHFIQLQESMTQLNYKHAITLLESLIQTRGTL